MIWDVLFYQQIFELDSQTVQTEEAYFERFLRGLDRAKLLTLAGTLVSDIDFPWR